VATLGGYFLRTHKLGEYQSDCQDALAFDAEKGLFAVADGATESFYAREWARLLAEGWVRAKASGSFDQAVWLCEAQKAWGNAINRIADEGRGNIFFVNSVNGLKQAFSTFLGIECKAVPRDPRRLQVEVTARGDSCLLHFVGNEFKESYPLKRAAEFTNNPNAISSREAVKNDEVRHTQLTLGEGDRLILATDAFAKLLLRSVETGTVAVAKFFELKNRGAAVEFIAQARSSHDLENDDIALIVLNCGARSDFEDWSFAAERQTAEDRDKSVVVLPPKPSPEEIDQREEAKPESEPKKKSWVGVIALLLLSLATGAGFAFGYWQLRTTQNRLSQLEHEMQQIRTIPENQAVTTGKKAEEAMPRATADGVPQTKHTSSVLDKTTAPAQEKKTQISKDVKKKWPVSAVHK